MIISLPSWDKTLNPIFVPLIQNKDRYLVCYGSRGSSKSIFAAKKLLYRCMSEPYFRCVLIRNTYATIKDSSYQTLKDIINEWGLEQYFEFKLQPLEIHFKPNGNFFLARGCDDSTKIKSIKDVCCAWYEEDIPLESDFITITSSIRTTKAIYLQEIFTINPEVEGNYQDNWFWKRFFDGRNENSFSSSVEFDVDKDTKVNLTYTVHHSTYLDNRWLPPEFKALLLDLKRTNPYYYTIYTLGHWGNKQLGGRFYKCFDIGKNTKINKYSPEIALHISFDFNVNPYMSCSVWQIVDKRVYQIDEIAMPSPDNTTSKTCKEFMRRYNSHTSGLFVYGDPSGKNEDTRSEKGFNDFLIIQRELERFRPILRVASSHPPVHMRGQWINSIFESGFGDMAIYINENSVYLKNDLLFGKEASDGTKLKEKVKVDGVSYEKYHHHCFVGDTLIQTIEGKKRIDKICVGDLVLTRNGYKKVLNVFDNGLKSVKRYEIDGNAITCTENHKFWTKEFGFIPVKLLIQWITFCIFDEKTNTWKRKLLFTKGQNSHDTLNQKGEPIGFITQAVLKVGKLGFTNINTSAKLGISPKIIAFIIKTKTLLITIYQTLNAKIGLLTNPDTHQQKKDEKFQRITCRNTQDQKRLNGMRQKKVGSGTVYTHLKCGIKNFLKRIPVLFVKKNINQTQLINSSIVPLTVTPIKEESQGLIMSKENVLLVKANLQPINIQNQKTAQNDAGLFIEKVYDIEVEEVHEYFANNILVSNSDGMDYFLCEAFAVEFQLYQRGDISKYKRTYGSNNQSERHRL